MEVVAEGIYHFIKWLVIQVLFEFIFYWTGRIALLIFTLGRYPKGSQIEREGTCNLVGGVIIISIVVFANIYGIDMKIFH